MAAAELTGVCLKGPGSKKWKMAAPHSGRPRRQGNGSASDCGSYLPLGETRPHRSLGLSFPAPPEVAGRKVLSRAGRFLPNLFPVLFGVNTPFYLVKEFSLPTIREMAEWGVLSTLRLTHVDKNNSSIYP